MRTIYAPLTLLMALVLAAVSTPLATARTETPVNVDAAIRPAGGMKAVQTGGNTVGDVIRETRPRADGYRHIDTPATIDVLKRLGVNTYVYLIWNSPTDWDDLVHEFAPAAERAGIRLWLYLVPPSECQDSPIRHENGRCSRPFTNDYVRWAKEIATLSKAHPNVVAWALDDFFSQLPPEEVQEMQRVQDAINPRLGFYTTVYYHDAINGAFYDRYEGLIDGIIYPYTGANSNTEDASHVGPNLEAILAQTEPRGLGVVLLAYTGRFLSAVTPPTDRYIADVIAETQPYLDSGRVHGITLYGLPIADERPLTALNRARSGTGWLSLSPAIFARTEPGDFAQAEQRIRIDPRAKSYGLEFSDLDIYYDQNSTSKQYHHRQILVDGEVVWESNEPGAGGTWHRHYVDLTDALRGKRSATLAIRLVDKTSLSLWTGVIVDDLVAKGFQLTNPGFEERGGWTLSKNSDSVLPGLFHFADFAPSNALEAARAAFAGKPHEQSSAGPADHAAGDAMEGQGRLRLAVQPFTTTLAGASATASQVLTVDPDSPRYEIDFFQTSPHTPYPGFDGAHQVTVRIDGKPVWTRDANWQYPFWENGNGLQGPIDVTDFVAGKQRVTLTFELRGLARSPAVGPNRAVDFGFDRLQTVGLAGRDFGFETGRGWRLTSEGPLTAEIHRPSRRAEAGRVVVKAGQVVGRPGTTVAVPVTVTNDTAAPLTGSLTASLPDGWSTSPAEQPFGPVPAGGTARATTSVVVPADAAPGSYWVVLDADSSAGTVKAASRVQLVGDTIVFTPGTDAEGPWLSEPDGSQLDGEIFDGRGRFADATTSFTYLFDLPPDVASGTLTLHIGNQYLVRVSADGETWREILREPREIRDLSNLADHSFDLDAVREPGKPLYVRVEDSKTDDGWGGWLGRLRLDLQSS
ncbi:NEW3 domain-containing protein [Tenggerimyces flavus]|uniref:NEW3 domain-containing protein n=1 Tax=Tenggerimyces flavus TaxID=1708749 RepID=A0ABV7YBL1_9ACTN|nr:NEW3 domain-containing protein [Tenggerimyces flavus]MBM7789051.1 hypothetical protein [Tenggerimyces flavus]